MARFATMFLVALVFMLVCLAPCFEARKQLKKNHVITIPSLETSNVDRKFKSFHSPGMGHGGNPPLRSTPSSGRGHYKEMFTSI
ncbi:hypothetical protein H5410_038783 [Solanum commersonii]|uniref:Transmembrane protein n=1 Tax=Solanum commersonii TaxID=4109 RepID=A0A9J5YCD4_SOLCO|nr:hypothetical protein H5410_038783 [Solanum commersonii]